MLYGICPNVEQRCEFSYRSRHLAQLHDLLQLIQARESEGKNVGDVNSPLHGFTRYFQRGRKCQSCGEVLFRALEPVVPIDSTSSEYERRIRLNHLLMLIGELQSRGLLES